MSIEHQTALSIIDLKPAIQPRTRHRIWLVLIGAVFGAGMQLGVTAAIHRGHGKHRALAGRLHHAQHLASWRSHHLPPSGCTFVRN